MRRRAAFVATALLLAGCGESVPMASGFEAQIRVAGGRYVAEPFPMGPDPDASGIPEQDASGPVPPPRVVVVQSINLGVRQGQRAKEFNGSVTFNARTVAIGMSGDRGYWIVPLTAPDVELPPNLTFRASVDFARDLPTGTRDLLFAGVDADGRFGPRRALPLTVRTELPDDPLAIVLDWDRAVDLDLVVLTPDGGAITYRGVRSPSGSYTRPVAGGPRVDINANAGCRIDGTNQEIATFPAPQPGRYEVRAHLFGACGEPASNWRVRVLRAGTVVSEARGVSYASETDNPGGGPTDDGRRALVFTVAP